MSDRRRLSTRIPFSVGCCCRKYAAVLLKPRRAKCPYPRAPTTNPYTSNKETSPGLNGRISCGNNYSYRNVVFIENLRRSLDHRIGPAGSKRCPPCCRLGWLLSPNSDWQKHEPAKTPHFHMDLHEINCIIDPLDWACHQRETWQHLLSHHQNWAGWGGREWSSARLTLRFRPPKKRTHG